MREALWKDPLSFVCLFGSSQLKGGQRPAKSSIRLSAMRPRWLLLLKLVVVLLSGGSSRDAGSSVGVVVVHAQRWGDAFPSPDLGVRWGACLTPYTPASDVAFLFGARVPGDVDGPADMHVYNVTANRWTLLTPTLSLPPSPRFWCTCFSPAPYLVYVHGGVGVRGAASEMHELAAGERFYAIDLRTLVWRALTEAVPPLAQGRSAGLWVPAMQQLLVFGGMEQVSLPYVCGADTTLFDYASSTWFVLTNSTGYTPPPACGSTLVLENSSSTIGYMALGWVSDDASLRPLQEVWRFDMRRREWSPVRIAVTIDGTAAPLPPPCHSAVFVAWNNMVNSVPFSLLSLSSLPPPPPPPLTHSKLCQKTRNLLLPRPLLW